MWIIYIIETTYFTSKNCLYNISDLFQISSSPHRNYLLIITCSLLFIIFVGGLLCGRVSKRARVEYVQKIRWINLCVWKSKLWFKGLIRKILRVNHLRFLRVIEQWKYIDEYNDPTVNSSIKWNILFDEYLKPKNKSYTSKFDKIIELIYILVYLKNRTTKVFELMKRFLIKWYVVYSINILIFFSQKSWCLEIIEWIKDIRVLSFKHLWYSPLLFRNRLF